MNKNEILIDLSESEITRVGKEEFSEQSFPQKVFSAIWEVESEVNNGGFSQYFLNDSAESASFVYPPSNTLVHPKRQISANVRLPLHFLAAYQKRWNPSVRPPEISQTRPSLS
jgi:Domain of unknown function (DUF4375)